MADWIVSAGGPAELAAKTGLDAGTLARTLDRYNAAALYAAGAVSRVWGHLTEHGGGLTDAIVFGRIAGEQAASSSADAEGCA